MVIPAPSAQFCGQPPCTVSVLVGGQLLPVGSTVNLPIGSTPLTYVITDSLGNTATSSTTVSVIGPPSIVAPSPVTISSLDPAGASVRPQLPISQYCGVPNCTVQVIVNGTTYAPGQQVPLLPPGNNSVIYLITDGTGQTANSSTVIQVINDPNAYV